MRVFQTLLAFSGNAPPQLALTRRLVERGHEVRVLAHRAARERIEGTGAEFIEFQRALPDLDLTRRETDALRDWDTRTRFGAGLRVRNNLLFAPLLETARENWRNADICVAGIGVDERAAAAKACAVPWSV